MNIIKNTTYAVSSILIAIIIASNLAFAADNVRISEYIWVILAIFYFILCIVLTHSTSGRKYEKLGTWLGFTLCLSPILVFIYAMIALSKIGC